MIHFLKNHSKKNSKKHVFYHLLGYYSLFFIVIFIGAFYPFWKNEKTFLWTADAVRIHYPSMHYIGTHIRNFIQDFISTGKSTIPMYDFSIGYGSDIIQYLGVYYLEALNFISIFVKSSNMELLYDILVIVRIYFTGIAFIILGYYKKSDYFGILCGALIYTFSGYTFFAGPRHPVFQTMVSLLPLLIYGLERIIDGHSFIPFSITVAYSAMVSWYCLYINSMIMLIYFITQLVFSINPHNIKKSIILTGKLLGAYLGGLSLSSIILIPSIIAFFNSGRQTSTMITDSLFYYDSVYSLQNLIYIFSPGKTPGYWIHTNCSVWGLFCVINTLLNKRNKKYISFFVILMISTFVPLVGFIMSGFNNVNNRWSFAVIFAISLITMEDSSILIKNNAAKLKIALYVYILIIGGIIFTNRSVQNQYVFVGIILLLFTFCSLFLIWETYKQYPLNSSKIAKVLALFIISINGIFLGRFAFSEYYGNYIKEFSDKGTVYSSIVSKTRSAAKKIEKDTFFRIDFNDTASSNANASMLADYYGINDQFNEIDKNLIQLLRDNGLFLYGINSVRGLNQRTILSTLANVHYFVQNKKTKDKRVPWGYEITENKNDFAIYKNLYALPLGYTYDKYIKNENYQTLETIDKQYAFLDGIILEKYGESFSPATIKKSTQIIDYTLTGNNIDFSYDSNEYLVTQKNGALSFQFNGKADTETILLLKNINIDNISKSSLSLKVSSNLGEYTVNVFSSYYLYQICDKGDFLINLGCLEEGPQTCTITFPSKGLITIDDIELYSCSMEPYAEKIEKLREESLENIAIGTNCISGDINLSRNKILCLGIPYSTGWTAFVDGQRTPLLKANIMFMALPLEAGYHTIELKYFTPGLKTGIIITFLSVFIITFYIFFQYHVKKYDTSLK